MLVAEVAHLFRISGHKVETSVKINNREIDVLADETQGLVRKKILIECADYTKPVGVDKIQTDINKLKAAKEVLKDNAVVMHVARSGYTPDAYGYASSNGVTVASLDDLKSKLVNFDDYVVAIENERLHAIVLKEYQPNNIHYEKSPKERKRGR